MKIVEYWSRYQHIGTLCVVVYIMTASYSVVTLLRRCCVEYLGEFNVHCSMYLPASLFGHVPMYNYLCILCSTAALHTVLCCAVLCCALQSTPRTSLHVNGQSSHLKPPVPARRHAVTPPRQSPSFAATLNQQCKAISILNLGP